MRNPVFSFFFRFFCAKMHFILVSFLWITSVISVPEHLTYDQHLLELLQHHHILLSTKLSVPIRAEYFVMKDSLDKLQNTIHTLQLFEKEVSTAVEEISELHTQTRQISHTIHQFQQKIEQIQITLEKSDSNHSELKKELARYLKEKSIHISTQNQLHGSIRILRSHQQDYIQWMRDLELNYSKQFEKYKEAFNTLVHIQDIQKNVFTLESKLTRLTHLLPTKFI